ncbi:MAG: hypothetical protein NVS2B6_05510 [Thermoleophilaceae bacterium]
MLVAANFFRRLGLLVGTGACAAALFVPSSATAASCANAGADPNSTPPGAIKAATLCLLNAQRTAHGLKPLRDNRRLDVASRRHATDMASRKYFAHGNFVGRIRAARYLAGKRSWIVGENIAWGTSDLATPAEIVKSWMQSPPHAANILNGSFREIGIGVARGAPARGLSDGATYATDFGARR